MTQVNIIDCDPQVNIIDCDPKVNTFCIIDCDPEVNIFDCDPKVNIIDCDPQVNIFNCDPQVNIIDCDPKGNIFICDPKVNIFNFYPKLNHVLTILTLELLSIQTIRCMYMTLVTWFKIIWKMTVCIIMLYIFLTIIKIIIKHHTISYFLFLMCHSTKFI